MKMSASCTWGTGNINHNFNNSSRRKQEHIDNTKIKENIILKDIKPSHIEKVFNDIFEDDVREYNKKQKRKDRQIENYYKKCLKDKRIKAPFREVIYQVGNKEDAKDPIKKEKMINSLTRFYLKFEEQYPKLKVIGAIIHLDEATPHLHLDIVPVAECNKKGLKHKVSYEKALEQMGFKPEESEINKKIKKPLIFNSFRNHSMKLLEDIMNNESIERDIKNNVKEHQSTYNFKLEQEVKAELKKDKNLRDEVVIKIVEEMPDKERDEIIEEQKKLVEEYYFEDKETQKKVIRELKESSDFQSIAIEELAKSTEIRQKAINKFIEKLNNSNENKLIMELQEQNSKIYDVVEFLKEEIKKVCKYIAKQIFNNSLSNEDKKEVFDYIEENTDEVIIDIIKDEYKDIEESEEEEILPR